mgnify:FL=1
MTVEAWRVQLTSLKVSAPELADPKLLRCIGEHIQCMRSGFTGSLDFDYKDGVPMGRRMTDCQRFNRKEG